MFQWQRTASDFSCSTTAERNSCKASVVTVPLRTNIIVNAPLSPFKQTSDLRGSCKCLDKHQNVPSVYRQQTLAASSFPSAVLCSVPGREHSYVRALATSNNFYKQSLLLARLLVKSSPFVIRMEFIDHEHFGL